MHAQIDTRIRKQICKNIDEITMSKEQKTNWLTRVVKAFLWLILLAIILIVLFIIWLFGRGDPRLQLRNYEELSILQLEPNSRPDGKKLPFSEVISTTLHWSEEFNGNVPNTLKLQDIRIARNDDGFVDVLVADLVKLDDAAAQSLLRELQLKFDKEEEGRNINRYIENLLCLNHTDFGPWIIAIEKKQDFFDFCLESLNVNKIAWELTLPKETDGALVSIHVTEYVGTNFFTVVR